ncbi:MAG: FAD-dependent oxidoreductase [Acidobacteriota bacterium]
MTNKGIVIVGGGQGGFQTAVSLRAEGYQDSITIIGDEAELPYQRPPLSKGLLSGKQEARHAMLRPAPFYATQRVELITGQRAAGIDRVGRAVTLASGQGIGYDSLVLATGARNRLLPIEGATLDGVCYLRTVAEALEIKQRIDLAQSIVVIGGGFIGLEVAAAAKAAGKSVTVIEAAPRLMGRVVAPVVSEYFLQTHAQQGVSVQLNVGVAGLRGSSGKVDAVLLKDGSVIPADLVVVGIGVVPNAELAQSAGLAIGNGIVVDEYLRTDDPSIFAIGDCAEYPNPFAQARVRLESVQNAVDQALSVAKSITGHSVPYEATPWFWTDQFDIKMQMTGLAHGFDTVVTRGEPEARKFSVFYYKGGELRSIDSINRPAEHLTARKIIGARTSISPEQAADESYDLKSAVAKN